MREDWLWEWRREINFLFLWLVAKAWRQPNRPYLQPVKNLFFNSRNNSCQFCFLLKEITEKSIIMVEKVMQNNEFFEEIKKSIHKQCEVLDKFSNKLKKTDVSKLSDEELYGLYKEFTDKWYETSMEVAVIRTLNKEGERVIREEIKKKVGNNVEQLMNMLISTDKESAFAEEEKELLEIVENKSKIREHWKKYKWMPCGYLNEMPFTEEDFLKRLNKIIQEGKVEERKKQLKQAPVKIREAKQKAIDLVKPSQEMLNLIEALSDCVYYKDFIRASMNRTHCASLSLLEEIGKRTSLTDLEVCTLSPEEVKKVLLDKKDYSNTIKERTNHYAIYSNDDGIILKTGKEAEELEAEILGEENYEDIKELKGSCASPGNAKGKVKVMRVPGDFEKGSILVVPMTTPEFTVFMEKAAAIVTDEGGLTCHAAIVSREMGKPCVIGTKIATSILKDGDMVEVDADKGIVRRISK